MVDQLARGLFTGFASSDDPFSGPNSMTENIRRLDDHMALYSLQPPLLPGTPRPTFPLPGDGQLYTDGTYAVFNGGAWRVYEPRKGIVVYLRGGAGEGWISQEGQWAHFFPGSKLWFDSGASGRQAMFGGTIRNNGNQSNEYEFWKLITQSGHTPFGFRNSAGLGKEIATFDDRVDIYTDIGGNSTGSMIVSVDETLAQTGLRLGPSGGHNLSQIQFYRDIIGTVSRNAAGNWIVGVNNGLKSATWDSTNNRLVVTHSQCPSSGVQVTQQGGIEIGSWYVQPTIVSATETWLNFTRIRPRVHSGRIGFVGGSYVIQGDAQNLSIDSYNPTSGVLTVNTVGGDVFAYDVGVHGYDTPFRPVLAGQSAARDQLMIKVYDLANNLVTSAPTAQCSMIVRAQSRVLPEQPAASTNFALRLNSRSNINPKSITVVDYDRGNLWILGAVVLV